MPNRNATMLTEDEKTLVEECALQLRIIQTDAAGVSPQQRGEYFLEAVNHAFKGHGGADRHRLLSALLERFPVGGRILQPAAAAPAAVAEPDSPAELLAKFIDSLDSVSAEQRAGFLRQLQAAGMVAEVPGAPQTFQMPAEALQKLGLKPGQSVDPERLLQLVLALVQLFSELDRTAYSTLKEIKRQNVPATRGFDLGFAAGQYLGGTGDLSQGLRPAAAVLGGLMAGILGGGREFGRQFSQKYSPAMIEQVVASEGKSGFLGPGKDERCWQKYQKLYQDIEAPDAVDRWVKECLAKFVELGARPGR